MNAIEEMIKGGASLEQIISFVAGYFYADASGGSCTEHEEMYYGAEQHAQCVSGEGRTYLDPRSAIRGYKQWKENNQ